MGNGFDLLQGQDAEVSLPTDEIDTAGRNPN
jgi:hypothetical protein